jgi:LemA protein
MLPIIIAVVAAILILLPIIWWISTGNKFKRGVIKIDEALSGIEVALTKRFDMLTKMLDVAKGFAKHEKELFAEVVNLRRGISVGELGQAAGQMDAMAGRLNVVAERLPGAAFKRRVRAAAIRRARRGRAFASGAAAL